jgi:hypothetical protein
VDVLGYAILTGTVIAGSAALLALPVFSFGRTLASGAGWGAAWRAVLMSDDDWETVPVLVLMAVLGGAALGILAAAVWLFTADRVQRPWTAHLAAAVAAAAGSCFLLLVSWPVAVATSLVAGLVTVIAAPRVGYRLVTDGTG